MKYLRITNGPAKLKGTIKLPASKSISNRALVIRALCETPFLIRNLSDADDTALLDSIFQSGEKELYVKNAGTAARFLLAYYASRPSDLMLTGSERMQKRPIGELVTALRQLGAEIEYTGTENHLPIHISGKYLSGGSVEIYADTSSQFVSALLMIAPGLKNGLTIEMKGDLVSESYIGLTLKMMAQFGIRYSKNGAFISVPCQKYRPKTWFVESDWSAASYFFAIAILNDGNELEFENLFETSLQGDSVITGLIKEFGASVAFKGRDCNIQKADGAPISVFRYDFINHPDLIPTFVCLCCALRISFHISGTRTLQYKESDRALVLKTELEKLGYTIETGENTMSFNGLANKTTEDLVYLNTYNDHRMAMSFAILASQNPNILIESPEVVEKSFPGFWEELRQLGFRFELKEYSL